MRTHTGLLLVHSLTRDFTSLYAKKLFVLACAFGACFASESVVLFLTVLWEEHFRDNFNLMNGIYFGLDLFGLSMVN